jgi:transcription antitermination factor NusG
MNSETEKQSWFAVQVRSRWESSTAGLLCGKGYNTLNPTYQTKARWSGRLKDVNAPLFPGYIFCQFDVHKRLPVLITPGVIAVVSRGRVPVPVTDSEIFAIQTVVSSGRPAEPWPYLELGHRVRIERDALAGLEGILIQFKGNHRIVVSVSLLQRSVSLEVDRSCITPIGGSRRAMIDPIGSNADFEEAVA